MRVWGVVVLLFLSVVVVKSQVCSEKDVLAEAKKIKLDTTVRVRRDWRDLSTTERNAFLNALVSLDKTGLLAQFQCYHLTETRSPQNDIIHGTSIFFLWHRIFLWQIETKLLAYGIPGLPYWSFEYDAVAPKSASVFSDDAFGTINTKTQCAVLSKSILNGINLSQSIYANSGCVKRNPDPSMDYLYDDAYMARVATTAKTFSDMEYGFGGPHASFHNYWGSGSFMRGMASPRDPVFWLFHANLDRHLTAWQLKRPTAGYTGPEKTLSRYAVSPQTALNLKTLNVQYQAPQAAARLTTLVSGSVGSISGTTTTGTRKRSENEDVCIREFAENFLATPLPASETFKKFLSPAGSPKNTFRLFLDTMDKGYDKLHDDDLVKNAADNIRFDQHLDWYAHIGALFEEFDSCTKGGLKNLGAKLSEPGILLSVMLNNLKHDDDLRADLSQFPLLIARSKDAGLDSASLDELFAAGQKLSGLLLKLVGASVADHESETGGRKKRNVDDVPPQWTCEPSHYGGNDGCDCGCGAPDPDCQDQKPADSFKGEPVPIFGCPKLPNIACVAGVCVSGGAAPSTWKCHPGDFNSTNGCDCNCGAFDPDCRTTYAPRYKSIAPFLFGITGCSNGINPQCGPDGTCLYKREVPQAWKCPNVQYGSGDGCHCGCGAYDPDCDDTKQNVTGCPCLNMKCRNTVGLCTGICRDYTVIVRRGAESADEADTTTTTTSSGLSGGAIAGIVVGSVVGAILLVALVAFIVTRKGSHEYSAVMQ